MSTTSLGTNQPNLWRNIPKNRWVCFW